MCCKRTLPFETPASHADWLHTDTVGWEVQIQPPTLTLD
jgi:hypothetical protein